MKSTEDELFRKAIEYNIDKAAVVEAANSTMPEVDPGTGEYIVDQTDASKPMTLRQLRSLAMSHKINGVDVREELDEKTGELAYHVSRWNSKQPHVYRCHVDHIPCERDAKEAFQVLSQQVRAEKA